MTCPALTIPSLNGTLKIKIERHHNQIGVLCLKVRRLYGGLASAEDVALAAKLLGVDLDGRPINVGAVYLRIEFLYLEPDALSCAHVGKVTGELVLASPILEHLASMLPPAPAAADEPTVELPAPPLAPADPAAVAF